MGRPRVRNKILLAAADILKERGVTALTTRGVAQYAGVTEASVFNNFRDKAGLIAALLREQLSEYRLFSEALAQAPDPDLSAWLTRVFGAARNYFQVVLPLAAPQLTRGPQVAPELSQERYIGHADLTARLIVFQEQSVVAREVDAGAAALLLMGAALHGALTAQTLGDNALDGNQELESGVIETLRILLSH